MLKIIWIILSIILIGIIFFYTPQQQNQGLTSFSTKSKFLGSPSSAEQFLNNFIISLITYYFLIAFLLNR